MKKTFNKKIIIDPKAVFKIYQKETLDQFGLGQVYPVAYDTAWLARIPCYPELDQPAYPKALTWLRENQLADGSWGSHFPYNAHGNVLSTLAAILAFAQWNYAEDNEKIYRGLNALSKLSMDLIKEKYATIGFELLLPSLITECKEKNLPISLNAVKEFDRYTQNYYEKIKLIKLNQKQQGDNRPASWWFSLEMLGTNTLYNGLNQYPLFEDMLSKSGSVAASPAATAYLLSAMRYRGKNLPRAEQYLQTIIDSFDSSNALPNVCPIDEFELSFSANYLLEAGVKPYHPFVKNLINHISERWQQRNETGLGYSSHFFIDPDCSAIGIKVLLSSGYKNINEKILLNFYNGSHIETYAGELNASVSSNIHVLHTLRLLPETPTSKIAIDNIIKWLEKQAIENKPFHKFFVDKWYFSSIYPTARAIIALQGLNDALSQQCMDWMLEHQYANGGFGAHGQPTAEETAFASLAITQWLNTGDPIAREILKNALRFLKTATLYPIIPLWIGKVLYCPKLVTSSVITAAQIALVAALKKFKTKDHSLKPISVNSNLSSNKFSYLHFDKGTFKELDDIHIKGSLLRAASACATRTDIRIIQEHNQQWLSDIGLGKTNKKLFKINIAPACAHAFREASMKELFLFSEYSLLILALDDVLDNEWHAIGTPKILRQVLTIFLKTLKNGNNTNGMNGNLSFPQMRLFIKAFSDIHNRIKEFNIEINYFLLSTKKFFDHLIKELTHRKQQTKLSITKYLNLRSYAGGTETSCELVFALKKINLNNTIRSNYYFKQFRKNAYRALILSNDLFSLEKEKNYLALTDNSIVLEKYIRNLDMQSAFNNCIKRYNHCLLQMQFYKSLLSKEKYQDNKTNAYLTSALSIIEDHIQAHLDWALQSSRYHSES